jgi:hypothetical protein
MNSKKKSTNPSLYELEVFVNITCLSIILIDCTAPSSNYNIIIIIVIKIIKKNKTKYIYYLSFIERPTSHSYFNIIHIKINSEIISKQFINNNMKMYCYSF